MQTYGGVSIPVPTPQVASSSSSTAPVAQEQLLERSEHYSNVLRVRRLAVLSSIAWPLFGLVDAFIVLAVHPGRYWVYLACRLAGVLAFTPAIVRVCSEPRPSPKLLRALELYVTIGMIVLIAIPTIEFRGLESPLILGAIVVVVARAVVTAEHWKQGIGPSVLLFTAYGFVTVLLTALSPVNRHQLTDSGAVATFALYQLFFGAVILMTLLGGNAVWELRRQVFESRSLGRYRLKKRIGKGGMGEVWLAHDTSLRRDVAVKLLSPKKEGLDEKAITRFHREIQATSELNHPHTVRVFDHGRTEDGLLYYAMELLEGEDLGALIKRKGHLPPRRAAHLLWQASRALAEAHTRGLIHRDLKPENLFVTNLGGESDYIKVLDFGLVRQEGETGQTLTRAGWAVGTPSYIAPEIVAGKEATPASDVYALGVVLYQTLTGRTPFAGKDARATLVANLRERPRAPSEVRGEKLPHRLEEVVMTCLEKDPKSRYGSAARLAAALEASMSYSGRQPIYSVEEENTVVDQAPPAFVA